MTNLLTKAINTMANAGIVAGDRILVAVSGGPDSVALLVLLDQAAKKTDLTLTVCNVNHLLRQDADADAEFTYRFAHQLGWPCAVVAVNVPAIITKTGMSIEECARTLRHQALTSIAKVTGSRWIAFGHTSDDRAETILMNILRGSGSRGLHGMPVREGNIIRPILEITRADVIGFLSGKQVKYRLDETNVDLGFERNLVRLKLIPYIERHIGAPVRLSLNRLAGIIEEEDALLEQMAEDSFSRIAAIDGHRVILKRRELKGLSRPLARRVVRIAIKHAKGDLQGLAFGHTEQVLENINRTHGSLSLPGKNIIKFEYENIIIGPVGKMIPATFRRRTLPVPGTVDLTELDLRISAKEAKPGLIRCDACEAYIERDKIERSLEVRMREPGDRFIPSGSSGSKKLQDYFVDEKVPASRRDAIPIVESNQSIVWVAGMRVDTRFAAKPNSTGVIKLSLEDLHTSGN